MGALIQAKRYIESHGHACHVDGDRLIAECGIVFPDGREAVEYETFTLASTVGEIREWLGY